MHQFPSVILELYPNYRRMSSESGYGEPSCFLILYPFSWILHVFVLCSTPHQTFDWNAPGYARHQNSLYPILSSHSLGIVNALTALFSALYYLLYIFLNCCGTKKNWKLNKFIGDFSISVDYLAFGHQILVRWPPPHELRIYFLLIFPMKAKGSPFEV